MRASAASSAGDARRDDVASPRSAARSLLLVRAAPTQPDPALPPFDWGLGSDGVRAVMALGDHLPPGTRRIVSAVRADARETARILGAVRALGDAVLVDERLDEVHTPDPGLEQNRELVHRYLTGGHVDGWEPPDAALRRFTDALHFARRAEIGARVVVSHGIVLSMWLAPRVGVEPFVLWARLRRPDIWCYDPAANAVIHVNR